MRQSVFLAAIFAAVSNANEPFEEPTEEQTKYDDKCLFCIDEGNLFCSEDGKTGTCLPATCEDNSPEGECILKPHGCDKTVMTAYSQCHYEAPPAEDCPVSLTITTD